MLRKGNGRAGEQIGRPREASDANDNKSENKA
jgi:hypothetical protein